MQVEIQGPFQMGTKKGYLTIGVKAAEPICIMVINNFFFLLLISFVIYFNQLHNDNKIIKKNEY